MRRTGGRFRRGLLVPQSLLVGRRQLQHEEELRTLADATLHVQPSAHESYEVAADSQAETRPLRVAAILGRLLDGLEAAIEIRALDREDARTVPIIALTANTFQEDREDAAAAGMDGFIPKPFDAQQLYETLRSYLPRKG